MKEIFQTFIGAVAGTSPMCTLACCKVRVMETGFIIWSVVALILAGIGVWDWNSKTAVGFYSGIKPPEVSDVKKYNHAVAKLWIVYALVFEVLGLPLVFMEQNSPLFILSVIGVIFSVIILAIAYTVILAKYSK